MDDNQPNVDDMDKLTRTDNQPNVDDMDKLTWMTINLT